MAMVILSTGLILLTTSWGGSFARIKKTQTNTDVAALLERKMVEIELEYQGKPLDSIEDKEDDFGSEYPQYSWKMEARELELPDLAGSMTAKEGGVDEMTMTVIKAFTEQVTKSVKEVKVTVIYKGGKKPLEYSAVQYFVDYDKELSVPGIPGMGGGQ